MNFPSNKTALFILSITAILLSRATFFFFKDTEGPNLLIVIVAAAITYFLSLAAYAFNLSNVKKMLLAILIQILVVTGAYIALNNVGTTIMENVSTSFDGKNSTFTIDGKEVTLVHGRSETESAPGSASKVTTVYFGNEITGDLTGDGLPDTAFMVTQSTGGSGLFYYTVVAMKTDYGYKTTNAFFIGDRIAPQNMYIPAGTTELHVNFAERKPGEPMTARASVGAVKLFKVTKGGTLEGLMK